MQEEFSAWTLHGDGPRDLRNRCAWDRVQTRDTLRPVPGRRGPRGGPRHRLGRPDGHPKRGGRICSCTLRGSWCWRRNTNRNSPPKMPPAILEAKNAAPSPPSLRAWARKEKWETLKRQEARAVHPREPASLTVCRRPCPICSERNDSKACGRCGGF